jgi:Uma2 family endonuclease
MATVATPGPLAQPAAPPARDDEFAGVWRLSVDQYHAMIQAGILGEDDPVELLEGVLVEKMAKNPAHATAKRLLMEALRQVLPSGWFVDDQDPVTTADSEPEPDVVVLRGSPRDYSTRHPGPNDTGMVCEVADSSLRHDRRQKNRLYSRARIREYWIVNLIDRQVEVYTDPTGPTKEPDYRNRQDYTAGASVPVVVDGREVGRLSVADLLP